MSLKYREFLMELIHRKVPEIDDEQSNLIIDSAEAHVSQGCSREQFDTLMQSETFRENLESSLSVLLDEIFNPIREEFSKDLPPS